MIALRKATEEDLMAVWDLASKHHEWKKYNAPYFEYPELTFDSYRNGMFSSLLKGENSLLIDCDNDVVGTVSSYWECEATRWLEAGIVIYLDKVWGKGVGSEALRLWISHLFNVHAIERVGITTWSGNPGMMRCAEKAGMILEGRLRKCRYYNGRYFDSIRYGVIREEWEGARNQ